MLVHMALSPELELALQPRLTQEKNLFATLL
jgi:hypothetical protein